MPPLKALHITSVHTNPHFSLLLAGMRRAIFLPAFFLLCLQLFAQTDSVLNIPLTGYVKDDRFDKYHLNLALFLTDKDEILSMDFEGTRPVKKIPVKRPAGYTAYAYGNIFFNGQKNSVNPGYVSVLVGNPYHKHPHLFVDVNQNFDFTDDPRFTLPFTDEPPLEFELSNDDLPEGRMKVVLTRNKLYGQKYDYKRYLDEYYSMSFPDRKFIGAEFSYREQRFITRAGIARMGKEAFRIALYDANANGKYNDPGMDKVMFINPGDSIFDATNPLNLVTLSEKGKPTYFEKNSKQYEVVLADAAGMFIQIRESNASADFNRIKAGKKVPKVTFTLARGEKFKLKKLCRKEVFLYFASPTGRNFRSDTMVLRQIAALDTNSLKVILVMFVRKSYELRIFQSDARPNYMLAYGTRDLSAKLGINSTPQSLYLGKRRNVKRYGLTPQDFLQEYLKEKNR